MPHLICYDIGQNSLRASLGRKIMAHGLDRINKSVYLGTIPRRSLTQLEQWIAQRMANKAAPEDSCIVIAVSAEQVQHLRVYGKNDLDTDEFSGVKSTLFL